MPRIFVVEKEWIKRYAIRILATGGSESAEKCVGIKRWRARCVAAKIAGNAACCRVPAAERTAEIYAGCFGTGCFGCGSRRSAGGGSGGASREYCGAGA